LKNQSLLEKQKRNLTKTTWTSCLSSKIKLKSKVKKKPQELLKKKKQSKLSCMSYLEFLSMSENPSLSRARSKKRKRLKKERKEVQLTDIKLDARSETTRGKCKVLGSSFQQTSTVKHVIPYQNRPSPTSLGHSEHFSPFFARLAFWEKSTFVFSLALK